MHLAGIEQDPNSGFYDVECTCGWWTREQFTTEAEAETAHAAHQREEANA